MMTIEGCKLKQGSLQHQHHQAYNTKTSSAWPSFFLPKHYEQCKEQMQQGKQCCNLQIKMITRPSHTSHAHARCYD
jgi:hypothetical protein